MTIAHSNTEPAVIFIDRIDDGIARLLVRWSIHQAPTPVMNGEPPQQQWEYSERVIKWALPQKYDTLEDVREYLSEIQNEIVNWAEATEMSSEILHQE